MRRCPARRVILGELQSSLILLERYHRQVRLAGGAVYLFEVEGLPRQLVEAGAGVERVREERPDGVDVLLLRRQLLPRLGEGGGPGGRGADRLRPGLGGPWRADPVRVAERDGVGKFGRGGKLVRVEKLDHGEGF